LVEEGWAMPEKVFVRNIPDKLWRTFKARANLEGITVSQAVQQALRQYLAGAGGRGPYRGAFDGIIGLGASGLSDVSERHDYYLAEEPGSYETRKQSRRKKKK
jgi:plasmid stability protein